MSDSHFDENYFLHGKELGISGYTDYRWLPDLTIPMACTIVSHLGIKPADSVLDFGCARGYLVRAMCELGYDAWGADTSEWAVANCDPSVASRIRTDLVGQFDWIIAKDVLEHVPRVDRKINELLEHARRGLFVVVPLSKFDFAPYVIPDYEGDVTHLQRHSLMTWVNKFIRQGWRVEASYRVPGVKDNWWRPGWEMGNGFIVARRIVE